MKRNYMILLLFFMEANFLFAQFDKNWLTGITEPLNTNLTVQFNQNDIVVDNSNWTIPIEATTGSISDSTGNLLFFSNGCNIYNKTGQIIQNGDGLNPGEMHDWVCDKIGYNAPKGITFLPFPGQPDQFMVIHMGMRYAPEMKLSQGPLYYSLLDANANNGEGALTEKNSLLIDAKLEPFSIVRHGNGRDWWLLVPEFQSNRYHLFLLDPSGLHEMLVQEIGPIMGCKRIGSTTFSLKGDRFGRHQNCQTAVFGFDRCNGELTFQHLFETPGHSFGGGGIAFSPNSRHLFTTTQLMIYEADLAAPNPSLDSSQLWDYQWGVSLGLMQYAPNGQIVIGGMSRTPFFSLITNPSFEGDSLGFQPKGLPLPAFQVRSIPNFPNFKLGDLHGSPCDSLGINSTAAPIHAAFLKIFPNPASQSISVQTEFNEPFFLSISDLTGKTWLRQRVSGNQLEIEWPPINPPGIHLLKIELPDGSVHFQKLIIIAN